MTGDWTTGTPRIVVHSCRSCGHRWYLDHTRCPRCGGLTVDHRTANGTGTAVAVTAADGTGLALVDLTDGIRILARCPQGTRPGDRVRVWFPDTEPVVPHVETTSREDTAWSGP